MRPTGKERLKPDKVCSKAQGWRSLIISISLVRHCNLFRHALSEYLRKRLWLWCSTRLSLNSKAPSEESLCRDDTPRQSCREHFTNIWQLLKFSFDFLRFTRTSFSIEGFNQKALLCNTLQMSVSVSNIVHITWTALYTTQRVNGDGWFQLPKF